MSESEKVVSLEEARRRHRPGVGHALMSRYDERWSCRMMVELSSESFDPDLLGVGSSPYEGDASAFGLKVPTFPTVSQTTRYLFRLWQVEVGFGKAILIHGIWQYATIRAEPPIVGTPECPTPPTELEVTSAGWKFSNGNISWHLRWEPNYFSQPNVYDPNQLPGTSPMLGGRDSGLLYNPPFAPPGVPYIPPGAGIPPGTDVDYLGTFRGLRYPNRQSRELSIPVFGPGRVTFYASVHQTNPATRCKLIVPPNVGRPEDQFVAAYEALDIPVFYGRVGGGAGIELFPCCDDLLKGH